MGSTCVNIIRNDSAKSSAACMLKIYVVWKKNLLQSSVHISETTIAGSLPLIYRGTAINSPAHTLTGPSDAQARLFACACR